MKLYYLIKNKKKSLFKFLFWFFFSLIFLNNYIYKKEYLSKIDNNYIEHAYSENKSYIHNKKINNFISPIYLLSRVLKFDLGYFILDLGNEFILLQKNDLNIEIKNNFIQLLSNYHNKIENLHLLYINDNGDQLSIDLNGKNIIQTDYANYFDTKKLISCEHDCYISDLYILYRANFYEQNLIIKNSFFDFKNTKKINGNKIDKNFFYYNYENKKIINYKLNNNFFIFYISIFKIKDLKFQIDTFIAIFLNIIFFILPVIFSLKFLKNKEFPINLFKKSLKINIFNHLLKYKKVPLIISVITLILVLCYFNFFLSIYILIIFLFLLRSIIHAKKN